MLMDEGIDGHLMFVDSEAEQFASVDEDAEIVCEGKGTVGAALK